MTKLTRLSQPQIIVPYNRQSIATATFSNIHSRLEIHTLNQPKPADRSGLLVSASDCGMRGPRFESCRE